MKLFIAVCLSLVAGTLTGQECNCPSELSFAIQYFEQNNPAFQTLKSDPRPLRKYRAGVRKLKKEVKSEKDYDRCIIYLERYVTLLKDHHSGIGFNIKRRDLSTEALIAEFRSSKEYRQFEKIPVDTGYLFAFLGQKDIADIQGIYSDGRGTIFGIMEKEPPHHYQAVVLRPTKLLDLGHILMELVRRPDSSFDITYNVGLLGFNFQRIFKNVVIENGQMPGFGFSKNVVPGPKGKSYAFRSLNDSSNYLRLGSFDGRLKHELDSFYRTIDEAIRCKPFLVIDLRNNGGGSEASYYNLLPYAYTNPLRIDSAIIWVSPENIKRYEEMGGGESESDLIGRMKAAKPYTFIPLSEETMHSWTLDSGTVMPRKIALLFDRGTASSAEGMILYYMQSSKVITVGENSGGYLGYGNVMTAQTPCGKFTLQSTTTKYFEKSKYEFTGIEPMFRLEKDRDWVLFADKLLREGEAE